MNSSAQTAEIRLQETQDFIDLHLLGDWVIGLLTIDINKTIEDFQLAILELAAYYYDYEDLQVNQSYIDPETGASGTEFTNAARSFRVLVDLLERHPESFLSGKPKSR